MRTLGLRLGRELANYGSGAPGPLQVEELPQCVDPPVQLSPPIRDFPLAGAGRFRSGEAVDLFV